MSVKINKQRKQNQIEYCIEKHGIKSGAAATGVVQNPEGDRDSKTAATPAATCWNKVIDMLFQVLQSMQTIERKACTGIVSHIQSFIGAR